MTKIEEWELNKITVKEAFAHSKVEHKKQKCVDGSTRNWKEDNTFCKCFNTHYHPRWREILSGQV